MKTLSACCAVCITLVSAQAATKIWDGGGANNQWGTADNWDLNTAPVGTDTLTFDGNTRTTSTNNILAGTQFNGINFAATAGTFRLSGNNINLAGDIINLSTNTQTISNALALQQNIIIDSGSGEVVLGGVISNAFSITKNGSGTLSLGGNNLYTGVILNQGTINNTTSNSGVLGNGNLTMANGTKIMNSNTGPFVSVVPSGSGNIQIAQSATVTFDVVNSGSRASTGGNTFVGNATYGNDVTIIKEGAGTLNLNQANAAFGSLAYNTYQVNAGKLEFSNDVRLGAANNRIILNGGGLYTSDNVTLNSGRILTLNNTANELEVNTSKILTINTTNQLTGLGGFNKTGLGQVTIAANTTYQGATTISSGTLLLTGTGNIASSASIYVKAGATLTNNSSSAITNSTTLEEGALIAGSSSFQPTTLSINGDIGDGLFSTFTLGSTPLLKSGNIVFTLSGVTSGVYTIFAGAAISGSYSTMQINSTSLASTGSGNFFGTGGGYEYTYTNSNNELIIAVPEKPTWAILAFAGTILMILRRRAQ